MSNWQDISDIIDMSKPRAQRDIVVGKVLTFNQEGSLHSYKVMRLPKNGRVWVRPITLMNPDHYGHDVNMTDETVKIYGTYFCEDCGVPVTQPSKFET
jgi:hypothetical protein